MLTLTDTASIVVKEIVARNSDVDGAGLRIEAESADGKEFGVAIATGPEDHDAVIEQGGARVYVEERAAQALDDKTLDARVGEDGRVAFDVLPQHV